MGKPVLFSGVQPSGNLTLGNYLGALQHWVKLQNQYDCLFSVVDLHTITVRQDPGQFHEYCYDVVALYLAAGIDPAQNHIFLQSQVAAHSQLAWVLSCYSYMGELSRMTQFKDKSQRHAANVNLGLFAYPVLMAADILLYHTQLVPVGLDQRQHLELARDIALRFNHFYGEIFTVPEGYFPTLGAKIMSLQEPTKKMSKSDSNPEATILILDPPEVIQRKAKRAVTDSGREIRYDPENQPGIANLLTILALVSGRDLPQLLPEWQGKGYGELKMAVADSLVAFLQPLQQRYQALRQDQGYLDGILRAGAEYAGEIATQTMNRVYEVLGFVLK